MGNSGNGDCVPVGTSFPGGTIGLPNSSTPNGASPGVIGGIPVGTSFPGGTIGLPNSSTPNGASPGVIGGIPVGGCIPLGSSHISGIDG